MPAGLPGWAVAALIAAVAGIGTEAFAVAPLLIDIARDFDMAATDAAFAISAYGLAVAVSAPLFGLFAGHLPRRRLIAAGMVIATIAGIVAATAQSFGMLLAARMLSGLACGAVLLFALSDLPPFGAADTPVQTHPIAERYVETTHDEVGIPNMVTTLLASYRGFDTLGEVMVVFTAGIAVLMLLGRCSRERAEDDH